MPEANGAGGIGDDAMFPGGILTNGETKSGSGTPWVLVAVFVLVIAGLVTAGTLVLINRSSDDLAAPSEETSFVTAGERHAGL